MMLIMDIDTYHRSHDNIIMAIEVLTIVYAGMWFIVLICTNFDVSFSLYLYIYTHSQGTIDIDLSIYVRYV